MPMMGSECGGGARLAGRTDPAVTFAVERVFAALMAGSPPPEVVDPPTERATRPAPGAPVRVPVYAPRPSWSSEEEGQPRRGLVPVGR